MKWLNIEIFLGCNTKARSCRLWVGNTIAVLAKCHKNKEGVVQDIAMNRKKDKCYCIQHNIWKSIVSRGLFRLSLLQSPMTVSNLISWWLKKYNQNIVWGASREEKLDYCICHQNIQEALSTREFSNWIMREDLVKPVPFYILIEHKHRDVLWSTRPPIFHRACYPKGRRHTQKANKKKKRENV